MLNKLTGIMVAIVAIIIILILGLIGLLGIGIASLFLGWWTILGIIMIIFSVILGILMPKIPVWIPILVIGVILVAVEYIEIV